MIIAIDLRALASGRGGIHEYILRLVPELVRLDRTIKFKLFFNSYSQKLRWLEDEPNVEWHQFAYPNRWLMFSSRIFFGPKLDQLVGGADVWFTPHLFVTALSPRCKQVITFHDLAWLRYPEFFTRRQNWWHRWQAPGLQVFLERGLVVGARQRLHPALPQPFEQKQLHEAAGRLQAAVAVQGGHHGFDGIRQQGLLLPAAGLFFPGPQPQIAPQLQALGHLAQVAGADQVGLDAGKFPFAQSREAGTERVAHEEAQDGVAQELHLLVVGGGGRRTARRIAVGAMGEGLGQPGRVAEPVTQAGFELLQGSDGGFHPGHRSS